MGIGREVADAYIDVHGDLTKFRNSLNKAAKQGESAGMENADRFMAGWEKRAQASFGKKYEGILDAAFSNKRIDWDRLVGTFDATGFDDAKEKITEFLGKARDESKITQSQFDKFNKALGSTFATIEEGDRLQAEAAEKKAKDKQRELLAEQQMQWEIARTRKEQDRYNESFAGMFKANRLNDMEADFKKIARSMNDMDWSKFTKGTDDLDTVTTRIRDVVEHMHDLGRVTDEEGQRIIKSVRDHVTAEDERRRALAATKEQTDRLKESQAAYNRSLAGMMDSQRLKDLDKSFQNIAKSLQEKDWSSISKGYNNMNEFRRSVQETATELRRTGRIGDEEFARINVGLNRAARGARGWSADLNSGASGMSRWQKIISNMQGSFRRMDGTVKMVLISILAGAGPLAAALSGAAAAGTALVSSLAMAASAIIPLAGAAVGLGAGIFLMVSAMDELKAGFPAVQQGFDNIAATWEKQSDNFAAAFGESFGTMLGALNTQLGSVDFGTPLGEAFSGIADAFTGIINGPGFTAFMQAMATDLPAAAEGLGVGLAGVFGWLTSTLAGAAPVAKMLGDDFARWGTNLSAAADAARESGAMNEVFEAARHALLAVLDLAGSLGSALGTVFRLGNAEGINLMNSLTGLIDKWNAWMKTAEGSSQMLEWFNNGTTIIKSMEPLIVGLGTALAGLVTPESIAQFGDLMSTLGEFLPILGEILGVVSALGIFNILAEALLAIGVAIQPLLGPLMELAQLLGPLISEAIAALTPLLSSIADALMPVIEAIIRIVQEVGPPLIEGIKAIVEALSPVIEKIGLVVQVIMAVLVPILSSLLTGAINAIVNIIEGLSKVFMGLWEVIEGVVKLVVAIFTGDFASIGGILQGIWDGVVKIFLGAVEAIWGLINLWIIGKAFGLIKSGFNAIKSFFDDIWNAMKGVVQNGMSGIANFISTGINTARTTVSNGLSAISNFFSTAWNGMVNLVRTAFSNIGGAVSSGISTVINFVRNLPSQIWNTLSNIGSNVMGIGSNIITGMMNGIRAKATDLLNSAMNAVKGAVDGVKNFLGIRSPSRLFMQIGGFVGEGMANGIDDKAKTVAEAAHSMAAATVAEFSESKMFIAGQDAASGLASGLISNKSAINSALSDIMPTDSDTAFKVSSANLRPGAADDASGSGGVIIEEGAVNIVTKTTDPEMSANMVIDGIVSARSTL